jgi:hypothetical protein
LNRCWPHPIGYLSGCKNSIMFKKYLALLLCICISHFSWAQKADPQKLVGPTWLLTGEIVSMEGKQPATDKDIHLDFTRDGKWKSTHTLQGVNTGTWQLDKNGKLLMTLSGKKTADIVLADGERLEMVYVGNNGTIRWQWEAAK